MAVTSKDNLTTRSENLVQQVRTLEGTQAYVTTGNEIPVTQLVWANGEMLPTTQIDRATTGFYVRPMFSKGEVILDISFQKQDRDNPKQADKRTTEVSTRLRIPLGEWAPLAGLGGTGKHTASGTVFSTKAAGNRQQGIEIKVETVK